MALLTTPLLPAGRNALKHTTKAICRHVSTTVQLPETTTTIAPPLPTISPSAPPTASPATASIPSRAAALMSKPGKSPTRKRMVKYMGAKYEQSQSGHLGSVVGDHYMPGMMLANPPKPADITLEMLMANQCHMGHATAIWNPANSRYILGIRQGIHIIKLESTAAHLLRAARVVEEVTFRGGLVLFAGTRKGQSEIVAKASDMAEACRVYTKWVPGTITNARVLLRAAKVKVVDVKDEKVPGFDRYLQKPRPIAPDLVVCLNPLENRALLHECAVSMIPTIGIIDTDADPTKVTYSIPANDDSLRSVAVIAGVLGRAGQEGQKRRKVAAESGVATWVMPTHLKRVVADIQEFESEIFKIEGMRPPGYKDRSELSEEEQKMKDASEDGSNNSEFNMTQNEEAALRDVLSRTQGEDFKPISFAEDADAEVAGDAPYAFGDPEDVEAATNGTVEEGTKAVEGAETTEGRKMSEDMFGGKGEKKD